MNSPISKRPATRSHPSQFVLALAVLALASLVFWPGLFGDWGRDDYMQLAMARMAGSPLPFFLTDHFVFPGAVFRPMGFASFWLGQVLFDSNYTGHAVMTLGLFLASLATLFSLLRALGIHPIPATLATALFACHPLAIGTALWWSARFDLLASLFALLALRLAAGHASQVGLAGLAGAPLMLLAALLSKETAVAAVPAIVLIFQYRAWMHGDRGAHLATLTILMTVGLFLIWRLAILGTFGSGITADQSLVSILADGIADWPVMAIGYVTFNARLSDLASLASGLAAVGLLIVLAFALIHRPTPSTNQADDFPRWLIILLGLSLLLVPALLQAPVARLNAAALSADATAVEAAMQSRLYFMSLVGLSLLLASALAFIVHIRSNILTMAAGMATLILLLVFAITSYRHAAEFAQQSRANARLAHKAVNTVLQLDLPTQQCQLLLAGAEPPADWSIYVSMDSIVKALHPRLDQIDHCFIHAEYPTFYHFVHADHADVDSYPFGPRISNGQALPRRTVGHLTVVHLQDPEDLSVVQREGIPTVELLPPEQPSID